MYLVGLVLAFVIAAALVPLVKKMSFALGAVDKPKPGTRKIHTKVMARGGGIAIYIAFITICLALLGNVGKPFWGLFVSSTTVLILGYIDDIRRLNPITKLSVQIVAALIAIVGFSISIDVISNPLGASFVLSEQSVKFVLGGMQFGFNPVALMITLIWLVGMTNTMNFVDGLDGLSGGIAAIAAFVMFGLALSSDVSQPQVAMTAIILAGACLGYLVFNFHPAKIFNGDSGAYFLGMTLGILAIYSGAKLATAVLVLGVPIIDAAWSAVRRILAGRSPFSADRGHLHFLLLDAGLTQRQAVLFIYGLCILFGMIALIASPTQKVVAMFAMVVFMVLLLLALSLKRNKKQIGKKTSN